MTASLSLLLSVTRVGCRGAQVVYGPHVRYPMEKFLREVGPSLPVLQYPDTCHPVRPRQTLLDES